MASPTPDSVNLEPDVQEEIDGSPQGDAVDSVLSVDPLDDLRPLGERFLDEERSPVFETRVEKAVELRESGNARFLKEDFVKALADFELGLFHVDFDELSYNFELMDKHREQIDQIRTPLRLNAAACLLKLKKPKRVIDYCDKVLEQEKTNVKALYRRAKAHEMSGNLDAALKDLQDAKKVAPSDDEVSRELAKTLVRVKDAQRRADAVWMGKIKLGPKSPAIHDSAKQKVVHGGVLARAWAALVGFWLWIVALFSGLFPRKPKDS